jgi:hypothetical protein
MPDQEMLREIKRVVELTSRVDERVKVIADNHDKMTERFDKFMEQHSLLAERVHKIELKGVTCDDVNAVVNRMTLLEGQAPYVLKIVEQSLEALNKLADRVTVVEKHQEVHTAKSGWMSYWFDWAVKLIAVLFMAYILAHLGLDKISVPAPF